RGAQRWADRGVLQRRADRARAGDLRTRESPGLSGIHRTGGVAVLVDAAAGGRGADGGGQSLRRAVAIRGRYQTGTEKSGMRIAAASVPTNLPATLAPPPPEMLARSDAPWAASRRRISSPGDTEPRSAGR